MGVEMMGLDLRVESVLKVVMVFFFEVMVREGGKGVNIKCLVLLMG